MSLLQEIQDIAVDANSNLETLLLKCRVLAQYLKHEDLKKWVENELNGYGEESDLPAYRSINHCLCYGNFSGRGARSGNVQLPTSLIPEEYRDELTKVELREGVGYIKRLLGEGDGPTLPYAWRAEYYKLFRGGPSSKMIHAWTVLPKVNVAELMSTIRNRILNFTLEIQSLAPNIEELESKDTAELTKKVTQIYNICIANITNAHTLQQKTVINIQQVEKVVVGDLSSLESILNEIGLEGSDINALKDAIKADGDRSRVQEPGPEVKSWLWKVMSKMVKGAGKVALNTGGIILAEVLMKYYDFN